MNANALLGSALIAAAVIAGCTPQPAPEEGAGDPVAATARAPAPATTASKPTDIREATFGGGCFWCVEAVFERLEGVRDVVSGYSGGHVANPTYEQICGKDTGHIEVCRVTYDANVVPYVDLLEVFFATHDPTTLDRQGNDVGPQYRSVVFYHDEEQREVAEEYKRLLGESGEYDDPIVTEIRKAEKFWQAEGYHQDYFDNNLAQPYCVYVVGPKVKKLKEKFADRLKKKKAAGAAGAAD